VNIVDIKNKTENEMIVGPGLTAKCVDVSDRKTGSGQHGEWSFQQLLLEDDSGKIRLAVWNCPDVSNLKDRLIEVCAHKGDNGWVGCTVQINEWRGKKYKQIKLMSTGDIRDCTIQATQGKPEGLSKIFSASSIPPSSSTSKASAIFRSSSS